MPHNEKTESDDVEKARDVHVRVKCWRTILLTERKKKKWRRMVRPLFWSRGTSIYSVRSVLPLLFPFGVQPSHLHCSTRVSVSPDRVTGNETERFSFCFYHRINLSLNLNFALNSGRYQSFRRFPTLKTFCLCTGILFLFLCQGPDFLSLSNTQ